MTSVVDFRAFVPTQECMESLLNLPPDLARYADKYHLSSEKMPTMSAEQLVSSLDDWGIDHMVLAGRGVTNDDIAEYVGYDRSRLSGVAAVSPRVGIKNAIDEVRRSHTLGFRMITLRPFLDGIRASDRAYYPIYAVCDEIGMAVVVHTSFNFGRGLLDFGRPLHLDEVAADFPELTIIASHGGWPWVNEMLAVAWHHENVYIETSSQRPVHMARPGSGWECLFNYGDGPLRSKLLWGSASPFLEMKRQLEEVKQLPISEKSLTMMLDSNPRKLLSNLGVEVYSSTEIDAV